ncbi:hypothetical protein E2C01_073538 [Portunus trituberculatus]|uniref:Uncharacterized protein n=1 Tax=Portunus trituberculatus TaxID=210409 RepID=A0A5B7IBX8_PORTR|nr:hypothetical protein [Portunus trituberculatus]
MPTTTITLISNPVLTNFGETRTGHGRPNPPLAIKLIQKAAYHSQLTRERRSAGQNNNNLHHNIHPDDPCPPVKNK